MEKADDIVSLEEGGFALIGDKCDHNYDVLSCGSVAKVLYMKIDDDGNLLEENSWPGLNFIERIPYFSITTTSNPNRSKDATNISYARMRGIGLGACKDIFPFTLGSNKKGLPSDSLKAATTLAISESMKDKVTIPFWSSC